jgi:hypothetical protein
VGDVVCEDEGRNSKAVKAAGGGVGVIWLRGVAIFRSVEVGGVGVIWLRGVAIFWSVEVGGVVSIGRLTAQKAGVLDRFTVAICTLNLLIFLSEGLLGRAESNSKQSLLSVGWRVLVLMLPAG